MKPTKEKSIKLLQKAGDRVKLIHSRQFVPVSDAEVWIRDTRLAISNIFGEQSSQMHDFLTALENYRTLPEGIPDKGKYFKLIAENLLGLLQSMSQEIEDYWPDESNEHPGSVVTPDPSPTATAEPSDGPSDKDIFIIHGHDHGTKDSVVLFLTRLGLNPIVLHEQANRGRSVIEKFEDYASVTYAVALLTPDDVGEAKAKADKLRPRPRQNVLFEFGYFIGKLGRTHVCGLMKGDVEIPSDYSGVLLISLDDASWQMQLLKELRAAKLPINVDAVL
jgi:hypothetical protein